jgi:multidrug efflux system outer membrane protein
MTRPRLLVPALLACAAGCAPRPELAVAPEILSTEWRAAPAAAAAETAVPGNLAEAFGSPALAALVARAMERNADLGAAAARVAQARAQLGLARAAALPVVGASAGLRTTRTDDSGQSLFDFSDGTAGLDISWEIDLFGRLKAGRRAARARAAAAVFDRDALALAVEADVARAFAQHAALGDRLALLDRNLASARELERIINVRRRHGAATGVDTGLQAIEVRQLEVERTRLVEARDRTRNALAILAGEEAPRFDLADAALAELTPAAIAPVQPALLLVRRPDLRAAEARIAAAEGDVAAARAAFLPRLRLGAGGLGQAAALGGPFGATLSIGADLLAPIFDRGRLKGELRYAGAAQRESVELYRGAILTALGEAEDALAAARHSAERAALLEQILTEARTTARLARLQYLEGEADLQTAVEADRLLIAVEDALAVAAQERLDAAIDLYRAMGGAARS